MISDPAPVRRRILLGVVVSCLIMILISALMPDQIQREVESKRQKIAALHAVAAPPQPSLAAIRIPWGPGMGTAPGRNVTIHVYAELGKALSRNDVLQPGWISGSNGQGATVIHLRFDTKDPDSVRLATILNATSSPAMSGGLALRQEAIGAGRRLSVASVAHRVRDFQRHLRPDQIAMARAGVMSEIMDGTATARPPGTILYECQGRFFEVPPPPTSSGVTVFGGYAPAISEITEVLADSRVTLP